VVDTDARALRVGADEERHMPGSKTLKSISVDLEVMTPDRLKKIVFGLDKSTDAEGVHWAIDFQFFQRDSKTAAFGDPLVKLVIDVKKSHHALAEETAVKGLNTRQTDHLLGPAAVAAQRLQEGKTTEDKVAATVERTLPKREA
jgi:hypothetical protein